MKGRLHEDIKFDYDDDDPNDGDDILRMKVKWMERNISLMIRIKIWREGHYADRFDDNSDYN